jgi:hypothetical protein
VAGGPEYNQPSTEIYPADPTVDEAIPGKARELLRQALSSLAAPSGAIMLAASAVDAMLKAKNLATGSLYERIEKAADAHLLTEDMAKWAHQVRLDANDQRHADEDAALPTGTDARHTVAFAAALGEFLFALPARVTRGIKESKPGGAA